MKRVVIRVARFPLPGVTLMAQDLMTYPGGKGANQAYAAARLGAIVAMIGQVGNDAQAAWLRDNLARAGVDVSQVRQDLAVSSGVATITIDGTGQNQIIIVPGANGSFLPERLRASDGTMATPHARASVTSASGVDGACTRYAVPPYRPAGRTSRSRSPANIDAAASMSRSATARSYNSVPGFRHSHGPLMSG